MTETIELLGRLIDYEAGKDAIHIAVAPVESINDLPLHPGQAVGFSDDFTTLYVEANPKGGFVGIVDPYLTQAVKRGERFWMFLYPKTITGLRHVWTHPDFDERESIDHKKAAMALERLTGEHLRWMDEFASQFGFTGERMVRAAKEWIEGGGHWNDGGTFEGYSVPYEFWEHYEKITGEQVDEDKKENFFTCSC